MRSFLRKSEEKRDCMSYARRGMTLENMIEYTNQIYKHKKLALVDKSPTPWNVSFNKRTGKVYNAFPEKKGIVDFIGISKGKGIAFDAKSTKVKTNFPLQNVKKHQVDYLLNYHEQGGYAFLIVYFEVHNEAYFLPIDKLIDWWEGQFKGGRKSIPYKWFKENLELIESKNGVPLDYLTILKKAEEKQVLPNASSE